MVFSLSKFDFSEDSCVVEDRNTFTNKVRFLNHLLILFLQFSLFAEDFTMTLLACLKDAL